jgi:hypothetical protein
MSQYFPQEPQRPQQQDPYSTYNPYNPYNSEPTYITPQAQVPSPYAQPQAQQPAQPPYASYARPNDGSGAPVVTAKKLSARIWQALVQFLGIRGVVVAGGALLAILAFFVLPMYSIYTVYYLAAGTLDDKWWLELLLAVVPLLIVIAFPVFERIRQQQRRWSLVIAGSGILGMLFYYWFINGLIGSDYWRFGVWSYLLGMALVAGGGISLFLWRRR